MLASFANNAIATKIKAMYGKRITEDQYREMAREKSVADVVKFLKEKTSYGNVLASAQPSMLHRGQLENLLWHERFSKYLRLMHYNQNPDDRFYGYIIIEVEIQQILQILRLLISDRPGDYITMLPSFIGKHSSYDFMELAKVRSYDDLLAVLQKTPYYEVLLPLKPAADEDINYTKCETALYTYFYGYLNEVVDKQFSGKARSDLHEIIDTRVELTNITTIYRIKRYFPNVSQDYLKQCLLPMRSRIPAKLLKQMIAAENDKQFIKLLTQSPYAKYMGTDEIAYIEYTTESIRYHISHRDIHFSNHAATVFLAYMVLNAIEISNLTNIIEGVEYNAPVSEIERLLIL